MRIFIATVQGPGLTIFQEVVLRPGLAGLFMNTQRPVPPGPATALSPARAGLRLAFAARVLLGCSAWACRCSSKFACSVDDPDYGRPWRPHQARWSTRSSTQPTPPSSAVAVSMARFIAAGPRLLEACRELRRIGIP